MNDDPLPTISINDVSVTEGNSGLTPAVFTVSLSNPSSTPISVAFATADGTAKAGSDYVALSRHRTREAIEELTEFIHEVRELSRNGERGERDDRGRRAPLDPATAALWIEEAQSIITALAT